MFLKFVSLQVVGKLNIPMGASCFKNICSKCHLPSLTNRNTGFYYYTCKATIPTQTQTQIACKIKQESGQEFDYVLCDLQIKTLLYHDLGTPDDFQKMEGFFLWLFCDKKPKGKFILSFFAEVIGFSVLKKLVNKNTKLICGKGRTKHEKFK